MSADEIKELYEAATAVVEEAWDGIDDGWDGFMLVPRDEFNRLIMAVPTSFD